VKQPCRSHDIEASLTQQHAKLAGSVATMMSKIQQVAHDAREKNAIVGHMLKHVQQDYGIETRRWSVAREAEPSRSCERELRQVLVGIVRIKADHLATWPKVRQERGRQISVALAMPSPRPCAGLKQLL
jgi:hypothetical protein